MICIYFVASLYKLNKRPIGIWISTLKCMYALKFSKFNGFFLSRSLYSFLHSFARCFCIPWLPSHNFHMDFASESFFLFLLYIYFRMVVFPFSIRILALRFWKADIKNPVQIWPDAEKYPLFSIWAFHFSICALCEPHSVGIWNMIYNLVIHSCTNEWRENIPVQRYK